MDEGHYNCIVHVTSVFFITREYAACGLFGYFPCHLASSLAPPKPKYTGKRALLWQEKTLPQSLMNATAHPLMVANTRQGIQMKRTWTWWEAEKQQKPPG